MGKYGTSAADQTQTSGVVQRSRHTDIRYTKQKKLTIKIIDIR